MTGMSYMFAGTHSFNQDISRWDVSSVENMASMFEKAKSFNQPLNEWDVRNAIFRTSMFKNAVNFNQPLDRWQFFEKELIKTSYHKVCLKVLFHLTKILILGMSAM